MANLLRRSGSSPIEHELRELRPAAPAKLVEALATRIQGRAGAAGLPTTPRRIALAAALTIAMLAIFGAFGGIGYAASAAQSVANTVAAAASQVTSSNNSNNPNKTTICHATGSATNPYVEITVSNNALPAHSDHESGGDIIPAPATGCPTGSSGGGQYEQKTTICHRTGSSTNPYVLITVANSALPAHQAHGDIIPAPPTGCPATIVNSAPVINVSASATVQYSDDLSIPLTATDVDAGQTLTFTQAGAPAGLALTDNHNGTASAHGAIASGAGTYAVTFTVSDGALTNAKTVSVTVTKENATVVYSGPTSFDKGTKVTLTAQLSQAADGSLGNLANATVDFVLTQGSTALTVSGVGVSASGAASAVAPNLNAGTWTVTVRPSADNAFFTGPTSAPATFTVKKK